MQENEFEKEIRKRMDDLKLVPGENVWKQVEVNIRKEKRRKKAFIFFWLTGLLLLGSGGVYFYNSLNKAKSISTTINDQTKSTENILSEKPERVEKNIAKNEENKAGTSKDISSKSDMAVIKQKESNKNIDQHSSLDQRNVDQGSKFKSSFATPRADTKAINNRQIIIDKKLVLDKSKLEQEGSSNRNDLSKEIGPGKVDSVKNDVIDKKLAAITKDTFKAVLPEDKQIASIKIRSSKKLQVGFLVFAGVSDNLTNLPLLSSANADYLNSVPSQNSSGGLSFPIQKLTYKSGFSYKLGVYVKKHLSQRTALSIGVNYSSASASSLVGRRTSTQRTFYDSSLDKAVSVNELYVYGRSVKFVNKYHLLELPVNILLPLNKNGEKPVLLSTGVSPAYMIGSRALYLNDRENVYYTENKQFKKLQLSAQTSLQFTVSRAAGFNITAGPEVQYSITNMATPAAGTDQHLFSAGVKVNVGLK